MNTKVEVERETDHHVVVGHKPTTKIGRPVLRLKKKIVEENKLKSLEQTVNAKYGHRRP